MLDTTFYVGCSTIIILGLMGSALVQLIGIEENNAKTSFETLSEKEIQFARALSSIIVLILLGIGSYGGIIYNLPPILIFMFGTLLISNKDVEYGTALKKLIHRILSINMQFAIDGCVLLISYYLVFYILKSKMIKIIIILLTVFYFVTLYLYI